MSLAGVFYLFSGCKAADPTPAPKVASYIGKWGNDRDTCGSLTDRVLEREYNITFNADNTFVISAYWCPEKGRVTGIYSYSMVNNTFKLKFIKATAPDGSVYVPTPNEIQKDESVLHTVFVSADGKKLTLTPGLVDNSPFVRDFVKR